MQGAFQRLSVALLEAMAAWVLPEMRAFGTGISELLHHEQHRPDGGERLRPGRRRLAPPQPHP